MLNRIVFCCMFLVLVSAQTSDNGGNVFIVYLVLSILCLVIMVNTYNKVNVPI